MGMLQDTPAADFDNLRETHAHEERLRLESLQLIEATEDLKRRLLISEKAMALIFAFAHDHQAQNDDELTLQMLGIRLFNAAASSIKLGLSGYYQQAFAIMRDVLETGFLLDYFRTSPEQISLWKNATEEQRKKKFGPLHIRMALDKRDGNQEQKRKKAYAALSEYASHATYRGFRMTMQEGMGQLGPFVDEKTLRGWLEEMVLRLGPAAVVFARQFQNADPAFVEFTRLFGIDLIQGVRR